MTTVHQNVINWNLARFVLYEREIERNVLASRDGLASMCAKEATRHMRNVEYIESLYR